MRTLEFAAAILATWRLTHLLVEENGPWHILDRVRRLLARVGLGTLAECFLCTSVWVAIAFALLMTRAWRELVILIPALSGGAILLDRATSNAQLDRLLDRELPR